MIKVIIIIISFFFIHNKYIFAKAFKNNGCEGTVQQEIYYEQKCMNYYNSSMLQTSKPGYAIFKFCNKETNCKCNEEEEHYSFNVCYPNQRMIMSLEDLDRTKKGFLGTLELSQIF
jgi:hypothetical protein